MMTMTMSNTYRPSTKNPSDDKSSDSEYNFDSDDDDTPNTNGFLVPYDDNPVPNQPYHGTKGVPMAGSNDKDDAPDETYDMDVPEDTKEVPDYPKGVPGNDANNNDSETIPVKKIEGVLDDDGTIEGVPHDGETKGVPEAQEGDDETENQHATIKEETTLSSQYVYQHRHHAPENK